MRMVSLLVVSVALARSAAADQSRPPTELEQLKELIGVWRCEGKSANGGKETRTRATYTVSPELDGFVVVGRMESPRSDAGPAYRGRDIYGYDAGARLFNLFGVDNMGSWSTMSSKGWQGDRMEWAGRSLVAGKEVTLKMSIARKGPREIAITGSQDEAAWESTCKR